jgi:hypothetical protein
MRPMATSPVIFALHFIHLSVNWSSSCGRPGTDFDVDTALPRGSEVTRLATALQAHTQLSSNARKHRVVSFNPSSSGTLTEFRPRETDIWRSLPWVVRR